jgi:hypothetical protein
MAVATQATSAASLPSRGVEWTILTTTNTGNSGWVDISGTLNWTVFLKGLESGSAVKIEGANGAAAPTNGSVLVAAQAPDANGVAAYVCSAAPYHWIRVTKTQGTTPTATTAVFHALFA